jgi:hypothetical protein
MQDLYLTSTNFNDHVMKRVGQTIVADKQAILDLLDGADIGIDPNASDVQIAEAYLQNLPDNDTLKYGTAYLIELKDKSNFDGEQIDNEAIYAIYDKLYDFWDIEPDGYESVEVDELEETSNAGGLLLGAVSGLGQKALEGQQKRKYGALDLATKQAESQQAVLAGILAQRQAQMQAQQKAQELKAKQRRTTIIAVSAVLGIVAITATILYFKTRKKNG